MPTPRPPLCGPGLPGVLRAAGFPVLRPPPDVSGRASRIAESVAASLPAGLSAQPPLNENGPGPGDPDLVRT